MNSRKSITPFTQTSPKRPSKLMGALSQLMLLVMLLNPIVTLRASASSTPQFTPSLLSQSTSPDVVNLAHPLDLESRLVCRQAIEEVYWQHRIWPEENLTPKPDLDQVLPAQVLQGRVGDELRRSNALAPLWQRPLTSAQLQAAIDCMI